MNLKVLFVSAIVIAAIGPAHADDNAQMDTTALDNALQTCHDSTNGDPSAMDACMQAQGFAKPDHGGHPPPPPPGANPELEAAMQACHDSAKDNVSAFDACMTQKGFSKPKQGEPHGTGAN